MRTVYQHDDLRVFRALGNLGRSAARRGVRDIEVRRDPMQPITHARMVWWRTRQERGQNPRSLPERMPRAQFTLQAPQLRRAPIRQKLRQRRKRQVPEAHRVNAGAQLQPGNIDRHRSE
jgi:hypothetical protein